MFFRFFEYRDARTNIYYSTRNSQLGPHMKLVGLYASSDKSCSDFDYPELPKINSNKTLQLLLIYFTLLVICRDTILLFILLMMTTCMADCTSPQEDKRHTDSTEQERRLEDLSLTDHNDLDGAQLLKGAFTTLLEANGGKTLTPPSKQAKNSKTTTHNSEPIKKEGKEASKVKPKKKSVKAATTEKEKSNKQNKENTTSAKKSTTDSAKKEEKKVNAREEYTNMRKAEIDKYMQQKKEYAPSSTDSPEVARFKTALRECTGNERYLKQENREQNENIGRLTMDLHALDKMYKNEETGRRDCMKRENSLKKELAELQQKLGERKQQTEINCPEMHAKLQEEFRQQTADGEQALIDCNKKLMTGVRK